MKKHKSEFRILTTEEMWILLIHKIKEVSPEMKCEVIKNYLEELQTINGELFNSVVNGIVYEKK